VQRGCRFHDLWNRLHDFYQNLMKRKTCLSIRVSMGGQWSKAALLQVASGLDDSTLQGGAMRDFEYRVDVLEVNLPETEDLEGIGMCGGKIELALGWAEQEGVVLIEIGIHGLLDRPAHIVVGRIAALIGVSLPLVCHVPKVPAGVRIGYHHIRARWAH